VSARATANAETLFVKLEFGYRTLSTVHNPNQAVWSSLHSALRAQPNSKIWLSSGPQIVLNLFSSSAKLASPIGHTEITQDIRSKMISQFAVSLHGVSATFENNHNPVMTNVNRVSEMRGHHAAVSSMGCALTIS
jgi:hypothetical protein